MLVIISPRIDPALVCCWLKPSCARRVIHEEEALSFTVDLPLRRDHPLNWNKRLYARAFKEAGVHRRFRPNLSVWDYFLVLCCCGSMIEDYFIDAKEVFVQYLLSVHPKDFPRLFKIEEQIERYRSDKTLKVGRSVITVILMEKITMGIIMNEDYSPFQLTDEKRDVYEDIRDDFDADIGIEWLGAYEDFRRDVMDG